MEGSSWTSSMAARISRALFCLPPPEPPPPASAPSSSTNQRASRSDSEETTCWSRCFKRTAPGHPNHHPSQEQGFDSYTFKDDNKDHFPNNVQAIIDSGDAEDQGIVSLDNLEEVLGEVAADDTSDRNTVEIDGEETGDDSDSSDSDGDDGNGGGGGVVSLGNLGDFLGDLEETDQKDNTSPQEKNPNPEEQVVASVSLDDYGLDMAAFSAGTASSPHSKDASYDASDDMKLGLHSKQSSEDDGKANGGPKTLSPTSSAIFGLGLPEDAGSSEDGVDDARMSEGIMAAFYSDETKDKNNPSSSLDTNNSVDLPLTSDASTNEAEDLPTPPKSSLKKTSSYHAPPPAKKKGAVKSIMKAARRSLGKGRKSKTNGGLDKGTENGEGEGTGPKLVFNEKVKWSRKSGTFGAEDLRIDDFDYLQNGVRDLLPNQYTAADKEVVVRGVAKEIREDGWSEDIIERYDQALEDLATMKREDWDNCLVEMKFIEEEKQKWSNAL